MHDTASVELRGSADCCTGARTGGACRTTRFSNTTTPSARRSKDTTHTQRNDSRLSIHAAAYRRPSPPFEVLQANPDPCAPFVSFIKAVCSGRTHNIYSFPSVSVLPLSLQAFSTVLVSRHRLFFLLRDAHALLPAIYAPSNIASLRIRTYDNHRRAVGFRADYSKPASIRDVLLLARTHTFSLDI